VFLAIKYAAPALSKICPEKGKHTPGGSLVLTASSKNAEDAHSVKLILVAGLKSNAGPMPYSASKAAVVSMAQTASYELAGRNIRVNAICPGLIQVGLVRYARLPRALGDQLSSEERDGLGSLQIGSRPPSAEDCPLYDREKLTVGADAAD
jgi:NAD(P)-dependent dehydrogenase (short-subunit alcohol dehydrogenase family)